MNTRFYRPNELLAGFGSEMPELLVPELRELGEQWALPRFKINWHANPGWELYLQMEGASIWETEHGRFKLPAGGYYILGPEIRHKLVRFSGPKQHFFFAVVDVPVVMGYCQLKTAAWVPDLHKKGANGLQLRSSFEALVREAVQRQSHRAATLRMLLGALVIEATRILEGSAEKGRLVPSHPAAARARSLLEANPESPWSLTALARLAGLSPNYLSELFREEFGMPPHRYLLELRLKRAANLLATTELSITEVAIEAGFNSGQHLARYFRNHFGQSALEYRMSAESKQEGARK